MYNHIYNNFFKGSESMRDIYTKIDQVKNKINDIEDEKYTDIFNSLSDIL